jgi:Fe2+ or Zn2+ uptake regulation protein
MRVEIPRLETPRHQAVVPSPVRPAEIRKALQDNGVTISFASIRNALRQLEARNAAEQAGDSRTWRYRGGGA